ncbi:MAG: hypothetical protein M1814_005778 [Vezdaea aestivalis]|nr:MAG: hypothetical protein M1814_005778 [Vezdaea aestivalis]
MPLESPISVSTRARVTGAIPPVLRFPLFVWLAVTISSLSYAFIETGLDQTLSEITPHTLSSEKRLVLLVSRVIELAVVWSANFDGLDASSLVFIARAPFLWLLYSHYNVAPASLVAILLLEIYTTYIPLSLLRTPSAIHTPPPTTQTLYTRALIDDLAVRSYVSLLGAGLYTAILQVGYRLFLGPLLITRFDGLRDLTAAYTTYPFINLLLALPLGWASREILFSASQAAGVMPEVSTPAGRVAKIRKFQPATATLEETFYHNIWNWSSRNKVLITRAAIATALVVGMTTIQLVCAIDGVDLIGALGWASVWGAGVATNALLFGWVGNV